MAYSIILQMTQKQEIETAGKVIESSAYNTVYGIWTYFTADDGQIDLNSGNYLGIGTLESFQKMKNYYGKESVIPVYIEVEDGERLIRAIRRERTGKTEIQRTLQAFSCR